MPLQRCAVNNKSGWKWGKSGKCYENKQEALKQGAAIEISKKAHGELCEQIKKYLSDR